MDKIVLSRDKDGLAVTNVPHNVKRHSPTGFEWNYFGSGPSDLALNILLQFTDEETADALYQRYKADVISQIPHKGGEIEAKDVRKWISNHMYLRNPSEDQES